MLDHVTLGVTDLARSQAFYDRALEPLGITRFYAGGENFAGYGAARKACFWIGQRLGQQTSAHIAFLAPDRATVRRFHAAALAAGATDNGAPGPRPHYHPACYGAFVLDPDGHNIKAVCHHPED